MDEKIKIIYGKEWNYPCIHIDVAVPYEENYQVKMMKNNDLKSFLEVTGNGRDGESRYTFRLNAGISVEKKYSSQKIDKEFMLLFTENLMRAVDEAKNYMLNPDYILLSPELVFIKEDEFRFCYIPLKKNSIPITLSSSFHEMTEYFVRKLDYEDTEAILLSYRLHKESMQESYELKKILEDFRKETKERTEELEKKETEKREIEDTPEERIEDKYFSCKLEEIENEEEESVKEEPFSYGTLKKMFYKIKNKRWGDWDDLITETSEKEK